MLGRFPTAVNAFVLVTILEVEMSLSSVGIYGEAGAPHVCTGGYHTAQSFVTYY
jgi:hypothetical protein